MYFNVHGVSFINKKAYGLGIYTGTSLISNIMILSGDCPGAARKVAANVPSSIKLLFLDLK